MTYTDFRPYEPFEPYTVSQPFFDVNESVQKK